MICHRRRSLLTRTAHHRSRPSSPSSRSRGGPRSSNQLFQTNPLFSSSYSAFVIDKCIVTEFLVIYTGIDLSLFLIKPRRNDHFTAVERLLSSTFITDSDYHFLKHCHRHCNIILLNDQSNPNNHDQCALFPI